MFLDLAKIVDGRLRERFDIPQESPIVAGYDAELGEPLRLDVELTTASVGMYVVSMALTGRVRVPCRRCLSPVEVVLEDDFTVVYREAEDETGGDIVVIPPKTTRLEIDSEVRDRLFVETERFPVCDGACKGICQVCGQDLNEGECDCQVEVADSRWGALAELEFDAE